MDSRCAVSLRVAVVCLGLSFVGRGADAQERPRVPVVVDYVGIEGVYLLIGTEQGARVGDTLTVFRTEEDPDPLGIIMFTAAARRRSVASVLEPGFEITRDDLIYVVLPTALPARRPVEQVPLTAGTDVPASAAAGGEGGPRVAGRVSLDFDARETRTSFDGELSGTTRRRFATPVTGVALTIADLPGGFRVEANVRASYRYMDAATVQPTTSLRVYDLSVVKAFDAVPIELRAGRFYNPYESYSAYWDGALMRLGGGSGFGIGAAAGFEPKRGNEGISQDVAKVTGFADFSSRGRSWRYDTDVSFHTLRPSLDGLADRSFVGWTQLLSVGRLSFNQRLRLERDADTGSWSLGQLRLRAGVGVIGALRLNVGYGRSRPALLRGTLLGLSPDREELTAGFSVLGSDGSLGLDVGSTQWAGTERGISLSASATRRVNGVLLFASGRRWSRTGLESLSASPGFGFSWRWLDTRLGYQFYRTAGVGTLTSHAGDLHFTARVNSVLRVTLRGQQQWGSNFRGTRLQLRIRRRF